MSFFKNIFSKKAKLPPVDLSILGTDLHSHLIPGIDDGAKTIDDSLKMLRRFSELGYQKVITTPHIMSDYYKNTPEIILGGLEKVNQAIKTEGIKIKIEAAAEYYLDYHLEELIKAKNILTFGNNHVLFELSFSNEPPRVIEIIFAFLTEGYKPIMAHVERYPFYFNQFDKIQEFKNRGCLIQLNINSLSGQYGQEVKLMAERMIEKGLVDVVGSDCHHIGHLELLNSVRTNPFLHKVVNQSNLLNKKL
ncbi:MAG TPA: capsular biosynthesis protein [Crocinitomix sp.]|nr:capsular biosynthesis protein [Crocinitomix sp.]